MQLTMRKGQEHKLVIDQRLDDPNELMYSAYQQALEALEEIVRQAQDFSSSYTAGGRTDSPSGLYGYAHNIIAFSGSRGQGKTSAMISFSNAMSAGFPEQRRLPDSLLGSCRFRVLPPFDPTILEENQSILAVVLSRMYRLAEDTWRRPDCGCSEADKNSLLELFQQCLSGINAIKFRKGEEIKTLHSIHEISDSSLLKDNFYQLTRRLLRFINAGEGANSFLVVQLDDTDFQIRKGYEILEDIRKYLTLPNIIILMATDLDMLHRALIQHFINEFQPGLQWKAVNANDLRKLESKYLDKLIPPTFTVYLPHLDDLIQQRNELVRLAYIDPREEARQQRPAVNLLLKPGCPCRTEDFSFQALLLRYVYRKTRIIFAEHSRYLHDLIPTTLRGLAQFLGLLSSMDDVPELGRDDPCLKDSHALAEAVDGQADILEVNLALFEGYFLNDWVHSKLPKEKAEVIERLSAAVPALRCRLAAELLEGLYPQKDRKGTVGVDDYTHLVRRLEDLKKAHRRPEDYYFFFAVHTFFTIKGHKALLRQKRRAVRAFFEEEENSEGERPLLVFDFSPESTGLPVWFDIPAIPEDVGENTMYCLIDPETADKLAERIGSRYAASKLLTDKDPTYFSVVNLIGLFMSLGSPEGRKLLSGELSQKDLYLAQTSAASIAINWDAQEKLLKLPAAAFDISGDSMPQYPGALRAVWGAIDKAIESVNACKRPGDPCPMVTSRLESMVNFFDGDGGLQRALRALEGSFGPRLPVDYLEEIFEIYEHAERLRVCMRREADNLEKIANLWIALANAHSKTPPEVKEQFDVNLLDNKFRIYLRPEIGASRSAAKSAFTRALNKNLKHLCEYFGFDEELLEATVKRGGIL